MIRIRLYECIGCEIRFGIDLDALDRNGITLTLAVCPVCGEMDATYEIGADEGYEVPYEAPAPEEPAGEELPS